MKRPFKRDVPAGAALTIAALVFLATVVMGRDDSGAAATVEQRAAPPPPAAPRADRPVSAEDLDLERLTRTRKDFAPQDLFASRTWIPAPPAIDLPATKPAPPPPSAPPLPFKYLGRMADSDKLVVFLEKGPDALSARVGDVLDNTYEVEMINETTVRFVYLPLGERQQLTVPAAN